MTAEQRIKALEKEVELLRQSLKSTGVAVHTGTQRRGFWAWFFGKRDASMEMQAVTLPTADATMEGAPASVRNVWQFGGHAARYVFSFGANIAQPCAASITYGVAAGGLVAIVAHYSGTVTVEHAIVAGSLAALLTLPVTLDDARKNRRIYTEAQSGQLSRVRKNEPVTIAEVRHTNERGALQQLSRLIVPAYVARDVPPEKLREFCAYAAQGRDLGVHTITALFMKRSAWLVIRGEMLMHGLLVERNRAGAVMLTRAGTEWCRRAASGKPKRRLVARILQ